MKFTNPKENELPKKGDLDASFSNVISIILKSRKDDSSPHHHREDYIVFDDDGLRITHDGLLLRTRTKHYYRKAPK